MGVNSDYDIEKRKQRKCESKIMNKRNNHRNALNK